MLLGKMKAQEEKPREERSVTSLCHPNRIVINVGGIRFETHRSTLRNIPDTRLSWIAESKASNADYDPVAKEYFFDRHPTMFLMILNYYRTGKLHAPDDVCGPAFEDELVFWGIDEKQIEPCCWGPYTQHREAQQTLGNLTLQHDSNGSDTEGTDVENTAKRFGICEEVEVEVKRSKWKRIQPKVWEFLDNPYSSKGAKVFTWLSLMLVFTMIAGFCMETHKQFRVLRNESDPVNPEGPLREYREKTRPVDALLYIESISMIIFTFEFAIRLIFSERKRDFFRQFLNWIDILSLVSFYIIKLIVLTQPDLEYNATFDFFKGLRLIRVFRIFKVTKHLQGLKILGHTFRASAKELFLTVVLIFILVIIFASTIYFVEQIGEDRNNDFESIPLGFWWAVVTMTTLGYGDIVPKTALGYVVGSICAICGVLAIALPIPIIVNNFAIFYTHAKAQEKLPKKQRHILVGAADVLKLQATPEATIEDNGLSIGCKSQDSFSLEREGSNASKVRSTDSGIKSVEVLSREQRYGPSTEMLELDQRNGRASSCVQKLVRERSPLLTRNSKGSIQSTAPIFVVSAHVPHSSQVQKQQHDVDDSSRRKSSLLPDSIPLNRDSKPRDSLSGWHGSARERERRRSILPPSYSWNIEECSG